MKSIKPGRGPSFMSGIGGIAVGIFGIIWIIGARCMGAPGIFSAFVVLFVLMAVGGAIYNFMNATGKQRFSAFDVVDGTEEVDPLNKRFGDRANASAHTEPSGDTAFCPYCGGKAEDDYRYCKKCGKELP